MSWDELFAWSEGNGLFGLGVISFLAATLLPLSSEIALGAALSSGASKTLAVLACSIGNCLACLLNYALGRWSRARSQERLRQSRTGRLALDWVDRYGLLGLLGAWLPAVGDPLTLVAGIARVPLYYFIPLVFGLRVGRYVVLAAMF